MPEQIPLMVDAATQELRQFTSDETIPRGQLSSALQVALTGLVTSDVSGVLASDTILQAIGKLQAQASGKVDKVAGKVLSSNDFTNDERVKLANIADQATKNATDAALRDRSTHTGTQPITSISGLEAQASAGVVAAIAMAQTFTSVPSTFQAWEIVVTQPHLRKMIWSSAQSKYVRAPWHPVGQAGYFLRSIPAGFLEVRADVVLQTADFPDLAEYLGVTDSTFVLDEARGEFIRNLDSGRGKDVGRVVGSPQGDAARLLSGAITSTAAAGGIWLGTEGGVGALKSRVASTPVATLTSSATATRGGGIGLDSSLVWPTADEFRVTNLAYRFAVTY
ncbi:hypothetical protein ACLS0R_16980 [Comamonas jiangduensis]|uniref:hypothetical protein n=1 Tax=Comamonas jiangduensis TaxID=1194168 RepID=UPI003BF87BA2